MLHILFCSYAIEVYKISDCTVDVCVVHLRVRKPDQSRPHTLEPSTSAITYWQIINESSVVCGTHSIVIVLVVVCVCQFQSV